MYSRLYLIKKIVQKKVHQNENASGTFKNRLIYTEKWKTVKNMGTSFLLRKQNEKFIIHPIFIESQRRRGRYILKHFNITALEVQIPFLLQRK